MIHQYYLNQIIEYIIHHFINLTLNLIKTKYIISYTIILKNGNLQIIPQE